MLQCCNLFTAFVIWSDLLWTGKLVSNNNFFNRTAEIASLQANFNNLINTTRVSPRRWGKSSLVKVAADKTTKKYKNIKVCHLDIFKIRSEEEFYHQLTIELLKTTSGKLSGYYSDFLLQPHF